MFDAKKFFRIIIGVALSVAVGTAAMIFVYALPNDRVVKNVRVGLELYEREGNYPSWALGEHSKLDNFTDAIMLLEVTHPVENLIEAAMLNPRYGLTHDENPVDALINSLNGNLSGLSEIIYPRYWHGYLVILKPFLMATQINHVRILVAYADFILFVTALLMFQKVLGTRIAVAFAAAVMTINLVSVSMSFQFSSVYVVTMLALIVMLKKNRRLQDDGRYPYFFAAVGILVAFFDFLTYPIFSLGLPLTTWYLLNRHEKIFPALKFMFGLMISWGVGYGGMWSGKWLVAQILTGTEVLSNGLHQVLVYTQATNDLAQIGWQITSLDAIQRNIAVVGHGPIRIFFFAAIIFLLYNLIRRKIHQPKKFLPYILPATLPFAWIFLASGHSHIHAFFVYRGLAVTVFALACAAIEILSPAQKN